MQRNAVIYTRFSTDMERDESCEDQERKIRTGLAHKGIDATNFEVIYDRATSGTKNDRVQFDQLRARIQRGEIGTLAVDDQARFSRADNAFCFITDLVYAGGRFISTGEGIDTTQEGWQLRVKVMELHNSTTIRPRGAGHKLARPPAPGRAYRTSRSSRSSASIASRSCCSRRSRARCDT